MAGVPFKGGLARIGNTGASGYSAALMTFQASVGGPAIYSGDPLQVNANGKVEVADGSGNNVGVAEGFFYLDPVDGTPVESNFVAAGTSSGNGVYNGVNFTNDAGAGVKVAPAQDATFLVKANASVPSTAVGNYYTLASAGGGSSYTGRSEGKLDVASATTAGAAVVQVIGVANLEATGSAGDTPDLAINTWDAPETIVKVKFAQVF